MNALKECYSTISYYRSSKQLSVLLANSFLVHLESLNKNHKFAFLPKGICNRIHKNFSVLSFIDYGKCMCFILASSVTHSMNVNMLNHGLATQSSFGTMPQDSSQ